MRLAEAYEEDGLDNVLRGDGLGSADLAKDSAELQVQEVAVCGLSKVYFIPN